MTNPSGRADERATGAHWPHVAIDVHCDTMSAPNWVRCPGCGRKFNGARGLRAHAATKFLDGACKFGAREEAARITEAQRASK